MEEEFGYGRNERNELNERNAQKKWETFVREKRKTVKAAMAAANSGVTQ